mmetsp:Transcript_32881/g.83459  ORF Transcript_32881/g.83459 Transcript_32881/m.83459 type:complete len:256 (+) Transcript_32881:2489-3256(+)
MMSMPPAPPAAPAAPLLPDISFCAISAYFMYCATLLDASAPKMEPMAERTLPWDTGWPSICDRKPSRSLKGSARFFISRFGPEPPPPAPSAASMDWMAATSTGGGGGPPALGPVMTTAWWSRMVPEWQQSAMKVNLTPGFLARGIRMVRRSSSVITFMSQGQMASSLLSFSSLLSEGTWVPWPEKWNTSTSPSCAAATSSFSLALMFLPVGWVVCLSVSIMTVMSASVNPKYWVSMALQPMTSLIQPRSSALVPG